MVKTKEELNQLKNEYETLNKKLKELTDDELKLVTGGTDLEGYKFVFYKFDFVYTNKYQTEYKMISEDVKTNDAFYKVPYTIEKRGDVSTREFGEEHTGSQSAQTLLLDYEENGGRLRAYN